MEIQEQTTVFIEQLNELFHRCGGGASIEWNDHLTGYETVREYFDHAFGNEAWEAVNYAEWCEGKAGYEEACRRNQYVCIRCYPHTPIGSFCYYHYELTRELLEHVCKILREATTQKA